MSAMPDRAMSDAQETQSSRWLTRRYALALSLIALLAFLAFAALTMVIAQQESTGAVVNISGRQRMLSQRTVLFVQRMLLAESATEYAQRAEQFGQALELFARSHDGLTQGDPELNLPAVMSDRVRAMYFSGSPSLDQRMREHIATLRRLAATPYGELERERDAIQSLVTNATGPLLKSLDAMVWQYQREGEAEIRTLHRMESGVLALTLFALMMEVLLIFRPMVRQVTSQMARLREISEHLNREVDTRRQAEAELTRARDDLEDRVEERTAELKREITEREKITRSLSESEQRFRSVSESANDAIVTINHHGDVVTWNRAAERVFLRSESEMLGQSVEQIMPPELRARHRAGLARLREGGESRVLNQVMELRGLRGDGSEFPLELSIASWHSGDQPFFSGILRDISERKRIEADMRAAKEEAETAAQVKSQFLATMSHEIRTPINALLGIGELMLESPLSADQRNMIELSNQSGSALLALINNILDLSKIEAGQLDLEVMGFDLHNLLANTVEILRLLAVERGNELGLEISDDTPQWQLGDAGRLRQILLNLISNAIKFTERGTIQVTARVEDANHLLLAVSDSGIGIPPEKLESIFHPFNQGDSSVTRRYGGTGLGLSICRQIIEHMNGDISVESREGSGSRFTVRLPLAVDPNEGQTETRERRQSSHRGMEWQLLADTPPKVLLAEDSPDNQFLIRAFLKSTPLRLELAEDGQQAVEMARHGEYQVILMDIQMPVMDGLTATRAIRESERATNRVPVPIVALTAHAMKDVTEQALAAGCNLYLSKPIAKKRLLAVLWDFCHPIE